MNGQIVYALVYKRLLTNRLYGKAAERAVLTVRLTGITVLQLQNPCIEYIYGKVEANELNKPSRLMAEALKRYHR